MRRFLFWLIEPLLMERLKEVVPKGYTLYIRKKKAQAKEEDI